MYAYAEADQCLSSHKVCFSLLLKSIIKTLEILSNIWKSVVVNGDKNYTVYTFSCGQVFERFRLYNLISCFLGKVVFMMVL